MSAAGNARSKKKLRDNLFNYLIIVCDPGRNGGPFAGLAVAGHVEFDCVFLIVPSWDLLEMAKEESKPFQNWRTVLDGSPASTSTTFLLLF